jgi:hypothetical protein
MSFTAGWPVWAIIPRDVSGRLREHGHFWFLQLSTGCTGNFGNFLTHRFLKDSKEFLCVSKRKTRVTIQLLKIKHSVPSVPVTTESQSHTKKKRFLISNMSMYLRLLL